MKLNTRKWIGGVISSGRRIAIPIMTHSGIEITGRTVRDAVTDGDVHARAVEALAARYPSAATSVIMDLTVEAEAFGAEISFADHEVPSVTGRLVADRNSIEALKIPSLDAGRVPEYLKACRIISEKADRPVFAGCIGPYSLAGRLYDMSEIMVAIYIELDTITALLEKCTAFLLRYCEELKRTGVTGVIMAEPAAGLLSDEDCQTYSTKYVRQVVEALQDDTFTIILHNCGNTGQCTQAMVDSGAAALHFGNAIDMRQALQACPTDVLVMGNLDPVGILKQSTPEVVYQKTLELLEQTASAKNYVLSTGCDVPMVPEANIQAFYQALDHFNSSF